MLRQFRPTLAVLFAATTLATPGSRLADPTARGALPQAATIAGKWRPDAALTHISSLTVNSDGTAKSWLYTFYSAKTKKSFLVTISPGAPLDTLEVPNTSTIPVGDAFVDSDMAMKEAAKHQLKGKSPSMGLVVMGSTGSATWSVNGGFAEGDVSVVLDGKTGAFIRRQVITYK